MHSLNITEQLVIFGVKDYVVMDNVLDLMMLLAKYYIFRCSCLKIIPNFTCFKKKREKKKRKKKKVVRQRAAMEKHLWSLKGDLTKHFSL